jgi:Rad3-related DNA helicase
MTPKKAAKKAAGKHHPHKSAKDARRSFEHFGRVQVLSSLTSCASDALRLITTTADAAYWAQCYKESADLLRAAEHLSFAVLHNQGAERVDADLQRAILDEFEHLMERAQDHASRHVTPKELRPLLTRLSSDARSALRGGSYRAALEFARGAEALSHVSEIGSMLLPGKPFAELKA